ncbi:MAG: alpha/beta fold hydrolase [Micromonosporaceae bacterium]|nr:alpha/beta fold hydrolase [Micromonosporaceae bacterium]
MAGWRAPLAVTLAALLAGGVGGALLFQTGDQTRRHVVVDGVPLDVVHPAGAARTSRRPGVVVAHGYAGSARLMAPFGDTLAARGYVVVLLDFTGHGADTRPLPDATASTAASTEALQRDLAVAMSYLRSLSDVDPDRVALVGHSMGADAVTRYALAHPEVRATVAISLPDSSFLPAKGPARLLLLVGGLEIPGIRAAAADWARRGGHTVVVPAVEHISILFAPGTHREMLAWLDGTFGLTGPATGVPLPGRAPGGHAPASPLRRPVGAALLLLAFLAGLYPVARLVLGGTGSWPGLPRPGPVVAACVAAVVALAVARIAARVPLPLALGGYLVGFTVAFGATMLGCSRLPRRGSPAGRPAWPPQPVRPVRLRLAIATPALIGYAAATIAVPLQLGLTHAVPVGARWWLLVCVWAGFAALAYGAGRACAGNSLGLLAVSAVAVVALALAAVTGLAPGFLVLIVPLLAILLLCQAVCSAVLHRYAAPAWLVAAVGSVLVAWPVATALPLVR